jgi:hypothetical protein
VSRPDQTANASFPGPGQRCLCHTWRLPANALPAEVSNHCKQYTALALGQRHGTPRVTVAIPLLRLPRHALARGTQQSLSANMGKECGQIRMRHSGRYFGLPYWSVAPSTPPCRLSLLILIVGKNRTSYDRIRMSISKVLRSAKPATPL